ncbi:MAG: hypothetical protein KAW41_06510 [Candidatus Diapherotrites archaeon]|nr:hypothetical protein [Candidatus Diapherotrites archaeon]
MIRYATLLLGAIVLLSALAVMDSLLLPLAMIVLGFMLLGYAFPELLENVTPYSKTVWMPLGFVVAAVVGSYVVFGGATFEVFMGAKWCSIEPCTPIGLVIVAFVVGSFARFGTLRLAGEKLDLFGENIKD